jgi:protoheme IX farnesyltransferase
MARTAGRPLPAGRLTNRQVTRFGILASAAGIAYLAIATGPLLVAMAALSWALYVLAYTPLKSISVWQTPVGAVAGAMPVLLGAAAVGEPASPVAWTLFGIVFFWQFPHSMAIAWLYRRQFASANVKLATVVDPSGKTAGRLAVFGSAALLPLSLAPLWRSAADWRFAACAAALGVVYLGGSVAFMWRPNEITARRLLRASLVYLVLLLAALLCLK